MARDQIFLRANSGSSDFEFDAQVAEVFDDMLVRSVPFYVEQQRMIAEIGKKFVIEETGVYDLGCSTATTLINLSREIDKPARFVGYDNSIPMIERARLKIKEHGYDQRVELRFGDLNGPLSKVCIDRASVVTMCWTLQFIRPLHRDGLIRWIHDGMVDNGALIVTEKVLANNARMNDLLVDCYYALKARNDYSETEIARKREALENVLVPYRIDENIELFRRNGFAEVETVFQWYNFAAFLCVKRPH
jgi:tRNA (cmo5U34)-methyltransferase